MAGFETWPTGAIQDYARLVGSTCKLISKIIIESDLIVGDLVHLAIIFFVV